MNWETVERRLERAFRARPRVFGSSLVVERRHPFPLARVMNEALTDDEREKWGDLVEWPGSLSQLLEQHAVVERTLLGFYWDGFGPTSSVAGLVLVGNGAKRYLCYWDEIDSYQALAAVTPWSDPLALSGTISHVLCRNGARFGLGLFGSLPTLTSNHAAELVLGAAVKQAYFDLMQWWQLERGDAWAGMAEGHYGRIVEPNHLQRCLDILHRLPRRDGGHEPGDWLEQRKADSAALPDEARQRLFDEWFASAYEEP